MKDIAADLYARIQASVPLPHVDVIPLSADPDARVGLILRRTPHQGRRWNLVGGRMEHGESLGAAINREVRGALGDGIALDVDDDEQPLHVAQYAPRTDPPFLFDPRKHAVSLTYAVVVTGPMAPRQEALDFAWFPMQELPPRRVWGFDQDRACEAALRRGGWAPRFRC